MKHVRTYQKKSKSRKRNSNRGVTSKSLPISNTHVVYRPRRSAGSQQLALPYEPPEEWHEPLEVTKDYSYILREPGKEHVHVLSMDEVTQRLSEVPKNFLKDLQYIQFCQMTRKKLSYPCYGLQWGACIYLYPMHESLAERYWYPPPPWKEIESKMYGGRWKHHRDGEYVLQWSQKTIKDFYLNNILIHELGHLVDARNSSSQDREQYAEWFAIKYGYKPTQHLRQSNKKKKIRKRHHATG